MKDERKTKDQLINELVELRQRVTELEVADAERKRAEEELIRLSSAVKTSVDSIVIIDVEGKIIDVNEAALKMYGADDKGDLIGQSCLDLIAPEYRENGLAGIEFVLEKGYDKSRGYDVITKDGRSIPVELSAAVMKDTDGKPIGIVIIARDITERKQVEEDLRKYRDHLEELVEERTTELIRANEQLQREITERKQVEEALRQRTAQLEALQQVGLEIAAELDLDSLLHSIVSQAVELVGGTAGGLYLYRPDLDVVMWVTSVGPNMAPIGTILHRGEGLSGKVWETGQPLTVDNYQHWDSRAAVYEGYPWTALVGVPVRWGKKFLGVLNVLTDAPRTFSPADAELLSLLATQAAIAIRNVCLFEGELEQRELAESLGEAAAVIRSTLDLDQVLDRILEQVSRVVPNDATNIMFIEGDRARVVRCRGYERFGTEELVSTLVFYIPETVGFQQMIESKEPMVIPGIATFPGWVQVQEWLSSYAAAPIIVRDEVIGFLNVDSATPGFFTQADAEALRAFADHAAAAIENARLYATQQQRAQESGLLLDVANTINSTLDMIGVLKLVAQRAAQVCGADRCTILLLDDEGKTLIPAMSQFASGTVDKKMWQFFKDSLYPRPLAEVPEAQQVLQEGRPIFIPDALASLLPRYWIEPFNVQSLLVVPMISKGQPIGVMGLDHTEEGKGFTAEQVNLAMTIGAQAAIAIENARLYEEAQRRIGELTGLHELSQAFSSMTDVRETYGELTKRMAQLIGCQSCTIATYNHQTREMRAQPPGYGVPDELVQSFRYKVDGPARDFWNFRFQGPLLVNDIGQMPDFFSQWIEGFGLFNLLIVPMAHEGRITGLVYAANKPGGFAEDDSKLLTIFASQAAVIIEVARLYEETRHRAEEMTSVYNIGVATTSTLSLDEVLKSVCEQVGLLIKVSSFYIALYDAEKEELRFELALDEGVPVEKFTRKIANGGGLSGWIVQSREPLLLRDMEKEELPIEAIVVGEPTRSWLGVPLLYRDQVVGVMGVQSYLPNAFDEDDQQLLSTIAAQVAIAVENARLFAETKKKANDLGLLLDTSTAISSTLDLDQILETVAHQITASLVATFCRITLLDEAGKNLVVHAGSPIRDREVEDGFGRQCPLDIVPWHRQVIETGQPVVLRQDVPELALSDEECKMALTEEVKSAALIPLIVGGRVLGVISLGEERGWERSPFTQEKMELCQSIATQAAVAIENARLYEELQQSFIQTIATLAAAVEAKDPYTGGHSQGTMELAAAIAQDVGLDDEEVELIRYACLLHDMGKIGISEQILGKPGPLDEDEWKIIRRHPTLGANIVNRAALLQKLVPIILHHHEHYDGHGYPEGLRGEDIPLKARILAVADAYQAMTSDRAYRPAMTVEQALTTLRQGADEQWDGKLVDVLYRIIREQGHHEEVER